MNSFETFFQLHHGESPLLIGNAWDVMSAKTFERSGFKAIATSSAAVANTMGYDDGEKMPFDLLLQVVERIIKQISLPFSVDLESGFSNTITGIIENIERLHDLGVVGINIEDSLKTEEGVLQQADDFEKTISSITNHLQRKNMNLFVNARTDAFLLNLPDPLAETITRINMYTCAGASGIFVPFIREKHDIKEVVESTKLPVNVLCMPQLPPFSELKDLGVKRISLGSTLYRALTASMENLLRTMGEEQSCGCLL